MPSPYYLRPKETHLPEGHDESLDPAEEPTDAARRGVPESQWPRRDTSAGPRGPRDRAAAPPPTDPARRSLPPFDWPVLPGGLIPNRSLRELGIPEPDLDPDIAMWPVTPVQRWPFSGSPAVGIWPKGWLGVDNDATAWVCTAGGQPGTWAPLGGAQAVFTPDDYGAVGDGAHDDSLAVQAAVNAAVAAAAGGNGQGIVQGVAGKTYALTHNGAPITDIWGTFYPAITLGSNVIVQNMAISTPYQTGTPQTAVFGIPDNMRNITIRACSFNGNQPSNASLEMFNYCVASGPCNNFTFSDNYVTNMGGGGVALGSGNYVRMDRNYITLVCGNPLKVGNGGSYHYFRDNILLDSLKLINGGLSSDECIIDGSNNTSNVEITGNYIRNFQGIAIAGNNSPLSNVLVADNMHVMTAAASQAPLIHGPSIGGGTVQPLNNIVVRNNYTDISALVITTGSNNVIGVFATVMSNVVVTGNICVMPSTATALQSGIHVGWTGAGTSTGIVVANNSISGIGQYFGLNLQTTSGAVVQDCTVTGNTMVASNIGVGFALIIQGGSIAANVIGNTFSGFTTSPIAGGSLPGVKAFRHNAGYVYGAGTVTVPGAPATAAPLTFPGGGPNIPVDSAFYVTAGTSTVQFALTYPSVGTPSTVTIPANGFGTIYVPAGTSVTVTYTAAPTWQWAGS